MGGFAWGEVGGEGARGCILHIWGVVCAVVRGRGKDGPVSLSAINAHTSRTLRNISEYVTAVGVSEMQETYIHRRVHGGMLLSETLENSLLRIEKSAFELVRLRVERVIRLDLKADYVVGKSREKVLVEHGGSVGAEDGELCLDDGWIFCSLENANSGM